MQTSSVSCRCGAMVGKCDLTAIEKWNTRAPTQVKVVSLEKCRKAIFEHLFSDDSGIKWVNLKESVSRGSYRADETNKRIRNIAKCVLDAAGVPYVD